MSSRFQTFDEGGDPAEGAARIAKLRAELTRRGLQGFVVPRADEHQSEYVPKNAERLAWLTGFTGSAGTAVILLEKAALVVDGRYTLQAPEQVDTTVITPVPLAETKVEAWIEANLPEGACLGYDPWLHTAAAVKKLEKAAANAGGSAVPVDMNPVDVIWIDRPLPPSAPVRAHPVELAGESSEDKLARIREKLGKDKVDALVVSDPHNLAWTVQHPRRRRRPYAAAARLRGHPRGRPPDRVPRSRQDDERGGRGARRCRRHRRAGGPRRRPRPPGQGQGQGPYR